MTLPGAFPQPHPSRSLHLSLPNSLPRPPRQHSQSTLSLDEASTPRSATFLHHHRNSEGQSHTGHTDNIPRTVTLEKKRLEDNRKGCEEGGRTALGFQQSMYGVEVWWRHEWSATGVEEKGGRCVWWRVAPAGGNIG
ncbi:hypothetical protein E2C01_069032 [Portunus trituberculatus]|uniref:Uncharacterized protein n=1 Tax=Portunus trituberculatus TaxID=210409 RepID=A0A5B7HTK1_PORTR|nr:hypothetical protein [Portunus trituberculatus]